MKSISKRQFDAFCYVRQAATSLFSEEILWFESGDKKVLAIVIQDLSDGKYGYVILGRDARNLFRAIEVSPDFKSSIPNLLDDLSIRLHYYCHDGQPNYPQGDEISKPTQIFKPVYEEDKLHCYFIKLAQESTYEAARNLISEIAYSFEDVDGNYIEQFQTTGFDARLWELYLHVFFNNSGFSIDKSKNVPDYCLEKLGEECFVEAVTVGANEQFDLPNPHSAEEVVEYSKDYMAIKFGSALFSKVNRKNKYWEIEHVKGHPFILAIHDYHQPPDTSSPASMTWSRAALSNYLFGIRDVVEFDVNGKPSSAMEETKNGLIPKMEVIKEHRFKHKVIPSNFFEQAGTEHVSAVLFSNAATIPTFNRMGKLAGLGSKDVKMIRSGVKMSESGRIISFATNIDSDSYEESWGDNMVMYHNNNAVNPVDPDLFDQITHIRYNKDIDGFEFIQNFNEYFSSTTSVIKIIEKNE